MSYCRFQNTLNDFADCLYALQDKDIDSVEEKSAAKRLYKLAQEYIEEFENVEDEIDEWGEY